MELRRRRGRLLAAALAGLSGLAAAPDDLSPVRVARVRAYIRHAWTTLTRSVHDLPRAAPDPKMGAAPDGRWPVYVSRKEDRARVEAALRAEVAPAGLRTIDLRVLPDPPASVTEHGLLYLPHAYVVPGGRFNEMYGWDSYFIQVGLLRDGRLALAKDMVENFLYEIEHYGTILNANRTYYLTRSQPPFLTEMILGVFERTRDRAWLARTVPAVDAYHRYWTTGAHLAGDTGLSRYHDAGQGPAPEVIAHENDEEGRSHYDRVREWYRSHEVTEYDLKRFYDREHDRLTEAFYEGDRAMRESGFDPSDRFGPFSVAIVDHAPVCLNALLYRMETEASRIHSILGHPAEAAEWTRRAAARRAAVDRLLWDEAAGLYFDYDYVHGRRSGYEFATTFFPLWAGLASPEQAARVRAGLARFEAPGGVLTSTRVSGSQWDAPFGWAPLQLVAVEGLRRYGYHDDADRLSRKFLALVAKEFAEHGTIVEKYDVVRRESDVAAGLKFGYTSNEIGFGWTNAVFVELWHGLRARRPPPRRP